jgi:hypothetical protein
MPALAAQHGVHPPAAAGAAGDVVDLGDLRREFRVLASASAGVGGLGEPAVVGGGGHADDPEDGLDPEAIVQLVTTVAGSGRVPGRKSRRGFENLVSPLRLGVLPPQPTQLLQSEVVGRSSR